MAARFTTLITLLALIFLTLTGCGDSTASAEEQTDPGTLTVALVPSEDALKMVEGFEPIRAHLEAKTGKKVQVNKATSYATVIEGLKSGNVDIAWLGPLSYNLAYRQAKVEPVCMGDDIEKGPVYHSLLLVKADSPYQSLQDLKDKKAAFVDPGSTSGNLVPTTLVVKTTGLKPDEFFEQLVYAGSHDASLIQLKSGSVDVAAVQDITFDDYVKKGEINPDDFRILAKSDPLPGSPIVVRAGLDPRLKEKIMDALLNAHKEGVKLEVTGMGEFKALVPASHQDFAFIGEMIDALGLTDDQLAN